MKRFFGILLVLMLLVTGLELQTNAASSTYGSCGENMTWRFDSSTGTLIITGSGYMYKFTESSDTGSFSTAPWRSLPIKAVKVGENVTGLCSYFCCREPELTEVSLPSTLKYIPSDGFAYCTSLKEIDLPESLSSLGWGSFQGCTALESIDLSHVTSIGSYAFSGCTALETVIMPETADALSEGAFEDCVNLHSVEIPSGISFIGRYAFMSCPLESVVIPEGVEQIGGSAFSGCTKLRSVSLPISLSIVDHYAFTGCTALEQVSYPGAGEDLANVSIYSNNEPLLNVRWDMIGVDAPQASIKKTEGYSVTLGWEPVEGAEHYEIWHNTNAYSHDFTHIGTVTGTEFTHSEPVKASNNFYRVRAYDGDTDTRSNWSERLVWFCQLLRPTDNVCGDEMTWAFDEATGVLTISGSGDMYDWLTIDENRAQISVSPWGDLPVTTVEFEGNITGIGEGAFMDCRELQQLEIPDTVTKIGKYTFVNCSALTEVKLPARVDSFDMEAAFRNCTALLQVTVPEGKTTVDKYAFQNCTALETVNLPANLVSIGDNAFNGCTSLTEFEIPDTVTTLSGNAFYGCVALESISIPETIQLIPAGCFRSCTALKTVYLPRSVTKVDSSAFFACDSLSEVYYGGNPNDRKSITFNSQNLELENAIWHYTYLGVLEPPKLTVTHNANGELQLLIERGEGASSCELSKATDPEGPYSVVSKKTISKKYTVKNLEVGVKYYFRIRALTTDFHEGSAYSEPVSGYRKLLMSWPTISMSCSGDTILTWTPVSNASGYEIWRSPYGSSNLEKIGTSTGNTFTDTTADRETSYYYRMIALHEIPECTSELSSYSYALAANRPDHCFGQWERISEPTLLAHGEERRTCSTCGNVESKKLEALKPAAPKVKISGNTTTGKPKLSWNAVDGANLYRIYRAAGSTGKYTYYKSTRSTSFTDTETRAGTNYYYKVQARNEETGKISSWSNIVNRVCDLRKPVVTLKVDTASGKPKVTFQKVSGAEKYYIVRSTSRTGTYSKVAAITGTSFIDKTAKAGKTYYYKVKALHAKDAADSAYSEVTNRVCDLAKPVVSITRKNGDPRLTWEKISGAQKYEVWRSTAKSGEYTKVKTTVTASSFTDTNVKAGKTYYYKVIAIHSNSAANSAYSSVKSITAK